VEIGLPTTRAEAENLLALAKHYTVHGFAKRIKRSRPTVQYWLSRARDIAGHGFVPGEPTYDPTIEPPPALVEKPRIRVKAGSGRYDYPSRPFTAVYFTDAHNQPGLSLDRFTWRARLVNEVRPDALVDGRLFENR
jgi:hypothetical protein